MTTNLRAPAALWRAQSTTLWTISSYAHRLPVGSMPRGPLASGEARRFDREALIARGGEVEDGTQFDPTTPERLVDNAVAAAGACIADDVRAFVCAHDARALALIDALRLLRDELPSAPIAVSRRAGDPSEPVWVTGRAAFESARAMVEAAERLSARLREARPAEWDYSVMIDLRRER